MNFNLSSEDHWTLTFDKNQFVRYGKMYLRKVKPGNVLPASLVKDPFVDVWMLDHFVFDTDEEATSTAYLHEYDQFLDNMHHQLKDFAANQGITAIFTCLDANSHDTLQRWGGWPFDWSLGLPNGKILAYLPLP